MTEHVINLIISMAKPLCCASVEAGNPALVEQ